MTALPMQPAAAGTGPWLLLALAGGLALAGCADPCHPEVAVQNCGPEESACGPRLGDRILDWNPDLEAMFPQVARLMAETGEDGAGANGTAEWANAGQTEAFWTLWGVPEGPDRQVFLRHVGTTFRVDDRPC